jgi:outer membrane murein-binding lipoprotein Lpp
VASRALLTSRVGSCPSAPTRLSLLQPARASPWFPLCAQEANRLLDARRSPDGTLVRAQQYSAAGDLRTLLERAASLAGELEAARREAAAAQSEAADARTRSAALEQAWTAALWRQATCECAGLLPPLHPPETQPVWGSCTSLRGIECNMLDLLRSAAHAHPSRCLVSISAMQKFSPITPHSTRPSLLAAEKRRCSRGTGFDPSAQPTFD